jgi:hypothetical protein
VICAGRNIGPERTAEAKIHEAGTTRIGKWKGGAKKESNSKLTASVPVEIKCTIDCAGEKLHLYSLR